MSQFLHNVAGYFDALSKQTKDDKVFWRYINTASNMRIVANEIETMIFQLGYAKETVQKCVSEIKRLQNQVYALQERIRDEGKENISV